MRYVILNLYVLEYKLVDDEGEFISELSPKVVKKLIQDGNLGEPEIEDNIVTWEVKN